MVVIILLVWRWCNIHTNSHTRMFGHIAISPFLGECTCVHTYIYSYIYIHTYVHMNLHTTHCNTHLAHERLDIKAGFRGSVMAVGHFRSVLGRQEMELELHARLDRQAALFLECCLCALESVARAVRVRGMCVCACVRVYTHARAKTRVQNNSPDMPAVWLQCTPRGSTVCTALCMYLWTRGFPPILRSHATHPTSRFQGTMTSEDTSGVASTSGSEGCKSRLAANPAKPAPASAT